MNKWFKVVTRLFAALFFIWGALFLPFYVWASPGPNPVLGWVMYLSSVFIPWAIAFWLFRVSMRSKNDDL